MMKAVSNKIVGTWEFISWTYVSPQGETVDFFGKESRGILMYDASGYMSVQMMKLPRSKMSVQRLFEGPPDEVVGAYATYAAYYGRYFERREGELVHVIEGSLFPNWTGKEEIRYAKLDGDLLVLSAPPIEMAGHQITFDVRWRRLRS